MILEPPKIKYVTASTFPLSMCHEVLGLDTMIYLCFVLGFVLFYASFFILYFLPYQEVLYFIFTFYQ